MDMEHSLKILAIDDLRDNLISMGAVIRDAFPDAKVSLASSGPDGIALAYQDDPDVILLDVIMPGMDGFAVCRKLKADKQLQHIPVVFVTALKTDRESRIRALEAGAEGFLSKPIDDMELTAQIRAMAKIKEANNRKREETRLLASLVQEQSAELLEELRQREQAEKMLRVSEANLHALIENTDASIVSRDQEGRVIVFNKSFATLIRKLFNVEARPGMRTTDYLPKEEQGYWNRILEHVLTGQQHREEFAWDFGGDVRHFELSLTPIQAGGQIIGSTEFTRDITQRKQIEIEKEKLQSQLLQSQKMESVGRLAGGVAHDYNNMLAVIFIEVELLRSRLPEGSPLLEYVEEILLAAMRSRDITRQLLAFSRQQIIAPKPCNLNTLIQEIEKSLIRLIGEDISLNVSLDPDPGQILIDPSQIDQILINLAVNARDAMPDGGRISIETSPCELDEEYCAKQLECSPGNYVCLTVRDTGIGMETETLANIFEPFFTTKEVGKGTGLGLATVFGIVKQNHGSITVESEVGVGTTFRIYFPRLPEVQKTQETVQTTSSVVAGTETILLVEDDESLRHATAAILATLGYRITAAANPSEALSFIENGDIPFDLLLTDVVMPGMSGAQLRDIMVAKKPDIKVLFMSGYTSEAIARKGVLDEGVSFIQKPFSVDDLAKKIREIMS